MPPRHSVYPARTTPDTSPDARPGSPVQIRRNAIFSRYSLVLTLIFILSGLSFLVPQRASAVAERTAAAKKQAAAAANAPAGAKTTGTAQQPDSNTISDAMSKVITKASNNLIPFDAASMSASRNSKPDTERNSFILEAEGSASPEGAKDASAVRQEALLNAKRQVLEDVQKHLASRPDMKNSAVAAATATKTPEDVITVLDMHDMPEGESTPDRYTVWIRAEVPIGPKPLPEDAKKRATPVPPHLNAHAPLTVRVWTDHRDYRQGEQIVIHMQGNKPFHARIVDVNTAGETVLLLPNDFAPSPAFKASIIYTVPGNKAPFKLDVSPPFGHDVITVYASDAPLPDLPAESIGAGLHSLTGGPELGKQMRAITVPPAGAATKPATRQNKRINKQPPLPAAAEFYEAEWIITTAPDPSASNPPAPDTPNATAPPDPAGTSAISGTPISNGTPETPPAQKP